MSRTRPQKIQTARQIAQDHAELNMSLNLDFDGTLLNGHSFVDPEMKRFFAKDPLSGRQVLTTEATPEALKACFADFEYLQILLRECHAANVKVNIVSRTYYERLTLILDAVGLSRENDPAQPRLDENGGFSQIVAREQLISLYGGNKELALESINKGKPFSMADDAEGPELAKTLTDRTKYFIFKGLPEFKSPEGIYNDKGDLIGQTAPDSHLQKGTRMTADEVEAVGFGMNSVRWEQFGQQLHRVVLQKRAAVHSEEPIYRNVVVAPTPKPLFLGVEERQARRGTIATSNSAPDKKFLDEEPRYGNIPTATGARTPDSAPFYGNIPNESRTESPPTIVPGSLYDYSHLSPINSPARIPGIGASLESLYAAPILQGTLAERAAARAAAAAARARAAAVNFAALDSEVPDFEEEDEPLPEPPTIPGNRSASPRNSLDKQIIGALDRNGVKALIGVKDTDDKEHVLTQLSDAIAEQSSGVAGLLAAEKHLHDARSGFGHFRKHPTEKQLVAERRSRLTNLIKAATDVIGLYKDSKSPNVDLILDGLRNAIFKACSEDLRYPRLEKDKEHCIAAVHNASIAKEALAETMKAERTKGLESLVEDLATHLPAQADAINAAFRDGPPRPRPVLNTTGLLAALDGISNTDSPLTVGAAQATTAPRRLGALGNAGTQSAPAALHVPPTLPPRRFTRPLFAEQEERPSAGAESPSATPLATREKPIRDNP